MADLQFYVLFNSISVISGHIRTMNGDYERLMQQNLFAVDKIQPESSPGPLA